MPLLVRDDQFPFALHYFTGIKEHNIAVRARAQAAGLIMVLISFNSYLYISWYPTYLQKARGVEPVASGWLASLVLAVSLPLWLALWIETRLVHRQPMLIRETRLGRSRR